MIETSSDYSAAPKSNYKPRTMRSDFESNDVQQSSYASHKIDVVPEMDAYNALTEGISAAQLYEAASMAQIDSDSTSSR